MSRAKAASSSVLVGGEGREVSRSELWLSSLWTAAFLCHHKQYGNFVGSSEDQADGVRKDEKNRLKDTRRATRNTDHTQTRGEITLLDCH